MHTKYVEILGWVETPVPSVQLRGYIVTEDAEYSRMSPFRHIFEEQELLFGSDTPQPDVLVAVRTQAWKNHAECWEKRYGTTP